MLESFWVAVGVVLPMAILMGIGVLVRIRGTADRETMRKVDRLTFRIFMPTLLFKNVYDVDLTQISLGTELLFAVCGSILIFSFSLVAFPRLIPDRKQAASVAQAMTRSNYMLYGIAVTEAIYGPGSAGITSLLGAVVVPLTNALSVVLLEVLQENRPKPLKLLLAILKNRVVIAAILALSMQFLHLRLPEILYSVVSSVSAVTTTLAFLSLGVSLDLGEMRENRRILTLGVLIRMVLLPLIFLPIAIMCGVRGASLCTLLVLFGAPAAVSSYPMAVEMGADGSLSGQLVCSTTAVSLFSIFLFTFVLRLLGFL